MGCNAMSQLHSPLTSFAVAGVGDLGLPIVKALAAAPSRPSVVVLTRSGSKEELPHGVKTAKVNYNMAQTVIDVLHEHRVEAVISTLSTTSIDVQYKLIDAAKAAGIKIFCPSEFGFPSQDATEGFLQKKSEVIDYLKSATVAYTRIYAGCFIDWLPTILGLQTGKVNLVNKGESKPISFTSIEDVAGFVAHAFTTFPPTRLTNTTFRLEGERATLQEVATKFRRPVRYVDAVPGETAEDSHFRTLIQHAFVTGLGSTRWDWKAGRELYLEETKGENARELWPGHVWNTIEQVALKSGY